MIDSVKCYTREFSLSRGHSLKALATVDSNGEVKVVREPHAALGDNWGCHVEKFGGGDMLFFDGPVPRLLYGSSLHECREEDAGKAQQKILRKLTAAGVSLPVDAFEDSVSVSRADFCRNLQVSHAVAEYTAALGRYRLPRTDLTQWNSETLLWANTRREYTFYDKLADLRAKEKDPRILREVQRTKGNILRVEYRALRGAVVRDIVGTQRVRFGQLFDRSLSRRVLVETMDRLVRREGGEVMQGYANLSQLIHLAKQKRRYSFPYVIGQEGARSIMAQFGYDYGKVLQFLLQHYPRRSAYRFRSMLQDMCAGFVAQEEAELVQEVRDRLAA